METALIQADLLVYQTAYATPVVSSAVESSATGGLLQSLVPPRGLVNCSAATAMSPATTTIDTTAFLLVASGIKT